MNSGPFINDWLRLLAVLGIELGVIVAVFTLLQRVLVSPKGRRLSWRSALIGSLLIVGFELAGVSRWMAGWWPADAADPQRVTIVSSNLDPTPELGSLPTASLNAPGGVTLHPPAFPSDNAPPLPIWWPGWVWLGGVMLLTGRMVVARLVFAVGLRRHRRFCEPQIARRVLELANLLGLSRRIRVFQLEDLPAPISYGAFRVGIVLPSQFGQDNDDASRDAMLLHELAHVSARDGFWHGAGDSGGCLFMVASRRLVDAARDGISLGVGRRRGQRGSREWSASAGGVSGANGAKVDRTRWFRLAGNSRKSLSFASGTAGGAIVGTRSVCQQSGPALGRACGRDVVAGRHGRDRWTCESPSGRDRLPWRTSWNASFGGLFLSQLAAAEPELSSRASETAPVDPIEWMPWSVAAVAEARSHGRTVLVHFTADWALDAAANEKIALDVPEVRERLRSLNAASFKADWTTPTNAAIEAELNRYGKVSVPLTLVYGPDVTMPPEVLPSALTPEMVLAALDRSTATRVNSTKTTKTTSPGSVSVPQASTVLFEAKALYDAGRLTEAKAKLTAVLKDDPRNEAARHYLSLIDKAQSAPKAATPSDALIPPASRKLIEAQSLYNAGLLTEATEKLEAILKEDPKSEVAQYYLSMIQKARSGPAAGIKRALLIERLDALRLDTFGGTLPLSAFVEKLGREIRAAVPSGGGMNFLITDKKQESDDLSSIVVQLEPPLRGASIRQILDAMVKGAGELIRYQVEDYAVVFTRAVPSLVQPAPALHTRWFKIDSKTFLRGIQGFDLVAEARQSGGGGRLQSAPGGVGIDHVTVVNSNDPIIMAARRFFTSAGVDFTTPGKQVFFNDRLGMLMVRATLEDLDVIEQAIQVIQTPPPQVVIEARFCEIPAEELSRLGFDWMLNELAQPKSTPAASDGHIDFGLPMPATNPPSALKGILTARQADLVLRALSQRSGVNILTTPKVTTLSGRQAQIKVVDIRSVVTHLAPRESTNGNAAMPRRRGGGRGGGEFELVPVTEPFETGPVLDVVPYVRADGVTIDLTLIATVKEFMGYDLETPPTRIDNSPVRSANPAYQGVTLPPIIGPELNRDRSRMGSGQPVAQVEPKPVFRLRQLIAPVRVWDGQTVVLSGGVDKLDLVRSKSAPVLGDLPLLGRLFRTEHVRKQQSKLVILVTVTIIDPAGNRVHETGEIPAGVPAQQ